MLFKNDKAEWICAVQDDESLQKVEEKLSRWIASTNFEFDQERSVMFNMPNLYEDGRDLANYDIEKGLGSIGMLYVVIGVRHFYWDTVWQQVLHFSPVLVWNGNQRR